MNQHELALKIAKESELSFDEANIALKGFIEAVSGMELQEHQLRLLELRKKKADSERMYYGTKGDRKRNSRDFRRFNHVKQTRNTGR